MMHDFVSKLLSLIIFSDYGKTITHVNDSCVVVFQLKIHQHRIAAEKPT